MTGKIKRRSLRYGGRPKADFGSLFTSVISPALNAAGSIADESIDNNKTVTIPSDPTKTPTMRLGGRKKCWIGAAIGAATSIAGSLFGNSAQKREMRRQQSIRDWQNATQEAANMSSVLNNSRDYQEDYLRQFRTAARLGKRLGAKGIYITDGGDATKIGNNTYLLRGGSHEDVNETGQTGIGINVGGNEVEAEGGEVAQKKNGALRIFSAQPILGGVSPAQAVMSGASKDKVFNAQQRFKSRHHLSDDGETYKNGGVKGPTYNKQTRRWYNAQGKMLRVGHGYYSQNSNRFVQYNTDGTVSRFSPLNWRDKELQGEKHTQSMRVGNKSIALKPAFTIGKGAMYSPIRVHKVQLKNNKNRGYTIDSEDITNDAINVVGGGEKLFGKKFKVQSLNTKFAIPYGKGININGREVSKNLLDSIAYNAGLNKYPIDKLTYAYGLPSQESHNGRIASGNIVNKNKSYNTKEYNNAIANMNVFKNFGVIPANVVVRNWSNKNDAATDKKNAYNLSTNLSPLYQSFDLFRRGLYNTGDKNHTNDVKTAGDLIINSPEFKTYWETSGKRQYTRGYNDTNKASSYDRMINSNKEYSRYINHYPNKRLFKLGGRCKLRNGGLTSKDRGSYKHPYPSVSSKDFAGGGRSYPIPTKADAVDALRLAGLHGRSDVKTKVYSRYPELRNKARNGAEIEPYYDWARNTSSNLGISFIDPTYDYRAYYDSVTPYERSLIRFAPQGTHFTDIGKTPKHPTFSNESKYSNDKTPGGTWNENVFVPNIWQFGNNGNSRRNKYMNNSGEGYFNGRVNVFPTSRKKHSLGGRMQLKNGGSWKAPVYNTNKYRVSNRMRRQIATWEGSDFAGQNRRFKGDAIGAKERELRQFMGKAYNYLNDNQRDALLSYYYNLVPKTFRGQMTKYRNALINAQTEQEYNDTLNNMRESINVGTNRKGMRGLRNRRATERNWFGYNYANPIQEKVDKTLTQVPDATKVVQPIMQQSVITKPIEINSQEGYVSNDNPQGYNIPQGRLYDFIKSNMKRQLRYGGYSRPVKGIRPKAELGWLGYPYPLPRKWDFTNINLGNYKPSILSKNYPYARGMDNKASQLENSDNYRDFSLYRTQLDETNPYVQALTKATGHSWNDIKDNNYNLRYDHKLGYNHFTPEVKEDKYGVWGEPIEQKTWLNDNKLDVKIPYAPQGDIDTKKTIPVDTKKTTEYDIHDNKFGMNPSTGDWIGLGVDTLAGLAGGIINYNAAKDIYVPGRAPIMLASKLPTNYNITPQLEEVKRYRDKLTGQTYNNTSSSVAALNRAGTINLNSLNELSKLWTTKENEENKMLTQDALNQQSVAETNIRNQIARESEIAKYRNAQSQAKYDAINASLTGLAQAYNNFYTNATKRYEDEIAMRTYLAGSEAATPYRMLSMGVPMSTRSRIGLLNQVGSITNPGPRPERKDYDSNASWSRAIDKWEKDNTLYKQRGQYKNMILRGINSKTKRKYGIG